MNDYKLHELCSLFPRMSDFDLACLKLDIQKHGQQKPIILHEGKIIDGQNRHLACKQLGIEPIFTEYDGDDIASYVLSVNLHRRHLTPGQQAVIVASVQDWGKAHKHGGARVSEQEELVPLETFSTSKERAVKSGASVKTQQKADKVVKANPELAAQVARGEVSLNKAVEQVSPKPKKAKKKAKPDAEIHPQEEVNTDVLEGLIADNESMVSELVTMHKIVNSDDKLVVALAEIKIHKELARIATERFNGVQAEKNELIKLIKSRNRTIDGLNKKLKDLESNKF